MAEIRAFQAADLEAVLDLCAAEGWRSLTEDPEHTGRALSAPGVVTVVASEGQDVVGFAQLLSDGEIQAFLANILVSREHRRRGCGRALVMEALRLGGGERIDLLSEGDAIGFYETFPHRRKPGVRIYPFRHQAG